ncbi:MAG: DUF3179 domain-containing (seleno)protein [Actinomycetota bacterium]
MAQRRTSLSRSRRLIALGLGLALVAAACSDSSDTEAVTDGGADSSEETAAETTTSAPPSTVEVAQVDGADDDAPTAFVDLPLDEKIDAFLEQPSSSLASNIAADMALTGERRWGPWLLDLMRLGPSNTTDEQVAGAMSILSGIERTSDQFINEDYRVYGQWVYDEAIDPGEGYREWKLGLYGPIDDDYPQLLDSVDDDLVLSRIQWGGVPRAGIPELNDPERVTAAEANEWMEDGEIVFGVVVNGEAVAYPFRILGHHELANDTVGGEPVSLIFCTLCRTALLFDRQVEGQVLDFQTSGLLISSNKIMVDVQTDTLWSHLNAVGIGGELEGVPLEQFPVEVTTWREWQDAHPDTETLAIPGPIFSDNPEQAPIAYAYDADSAYRFYYDDPNVWFPILDTPTDEVDLKESVIGLDFGGEQLAIPVDDIVAAGPRVFEVGGQSVLLVPNSAGARVYDANDAGLADGDAPEVSSSDVDTAVLADGSELPRMVVSQGLWFAWFGDHPNTEIWAG